MCTSFHTCQDNNNVKVLGIIDSVQASTNNVKVLGIDSVKETHNKHTTMCKVSVKETHNNVYKPSTQCV